MRSWILALAALAAFANALPAEAAARRPTAGLQAFHSDAELRRFLNRSRNGQPVPPPAPVPAPPPVPTAPVPPPIVSLPSQAPEGAIEEIVVTASRMESSDQDTPVAVSAFSNESITNTQEANVDEGGIVKNRGEMLVVLRRGRLFSVSAAGGKLTALDHIDASPPGINPGGDWYDEMLLVGDQVIVIGYSYNRGGTEVNRFRLSAEGKFSFIDGYHLRASDYYSAENYASRLIGTKLIFYSGRELYWDSDPLETLPALQRWQGQKGPDEGFRRIVNGSNVFVPPLLRGKGVDLTTVHSVIVCDLAKREMSCEATSVLGSEARVFYVSASAVYLWVTDYDWDGDNARLPPAMVYRLPLDGSRPSAIGVAGEPADQFSFQEDARSRMLNVVVLAESGGDRMWRKTAADGAVALLRIPLAEFGDGSRALPFSRYRDLPAPTEGAGDFTNRFVGDQLLYGSGSGWGDRGPGEGRVVAVPVRGGDIRQFDMPHPVDRIEVMGPDAVIVGSTDRAMTFSTVELPSTGAKLGDRYILPDAAEAETRSHAFFYRPDPPDGTNGVLGLPVSRAGNPAYNQLFQTASSMFFLRRQARKFDPLGELKPAAEGFADDACVASCVDWYGNARPIFLRGRVYALLGYELVEGRIEEGKIHEVGRVNFAPSPNR
ncbi:MAG: putative lipoprotein [Caulobacter sp.]|nr:putative lipoprotein [Caulobacter sp.]